MWSHDATVRVLLDRRASIYSGYTPLACCEWSWHGSKLFICSSTVGSMINNKMIWGGGVIIALHFASLHWGSLSTVALLLDHWACIDLQTFSGETPLHCANLKINLKISQSTDSSRGKHLYPKLSWSDTFALSLYAWIWKQAHNSSRMGCKYTPTKTESLAPCHHKETGRILSPYSLTMGQQLTSKIFLQRHHWLMLACSYGHEKTVSFSLILVQALRFKIALEVALQCMLLLEAIKILWPCCLTLEQQIDKTDDRGRTHWMHACAKGLGKIVGLLLGSWGKS